LFRPLSIIDVSIDPVPADEDALVIVDWRYCHLEPAGLSFKAAKACFCRPSLPGMSQIPPPGLELLDIVAMDDRFLLRSVQLI
jgi:hypothetical protein